MFTINVKPKQVYLDATKPKVVKLQGDPVGQSFEESLSYYLEEVFEDGSIGSRQEVTLEGDNYNKWVDDTPYLKEKLASFCGCEIAEVEFKTKAVLAVEKAIEDAKIAEKGKEEKKDEPK